MFIFYVCMIKKKKKIEKHKSVKKIENQNRMFESYKYGLKLILMLLNLKKKKEHQIS